VCRADVFLKEHRSSYSLNFPRSSVDDDHIFILGAYSAVQDADRTRRGEPFISLQKFDEPSPIRAQLVEFLHHGNTQIRQIGKGLESDPNV
jgi:hypothetical protein